MKPLLPFFLTNETDNRKPSKYFARQIVFILIFGCFFMCWLLFNHATPWTRKIVSDITGMSGALFATAWAFQGTFQKKKRVWGADCIAAYLLLYSAGMVSWTYLELIKRQEAPFPSLADAFYIPSQIFLMAGILLLPFRRAPAALRGRVLLDGLMVMAALLAFSWYFVLGPNLLASAATALAKAVGVYYPLGDLAMLVCLLCLTARAPSSSLRSAYSLLAVGVFGIIVSDSIYGYLALKDTYASGSLVDIGWPFCQLLVALAVATLRKRARETEESKDETISERNPVLWRSLLPYALVVPLCALIGFVQRTHIHPVLDTGVYVSSAALIGLILLRQVFALIENNRLYDYLKQAYQEVEANHQEMQHKNLLMEQANADLAQANARLEALAYTDGMTGLYNHRTFQEKLREVWASSRETRESFALLLMDVDKFKQYNDTYGHPAGDDALRLVAQAIRDTIRPSDIAARYGGEEFAIVLPHTETAEMLNIAEKIRAAIEARHFPHRDVTISIGVVEADSACTGPEELIVNADKALYLAKSNGRNCVCQVEGKSTTMQKAA